MAADQKRRPACPSTQTTISSPPYSPGLSAQALYLKVQAMEKKNRKSTPPTSRKPLIILGVLVLVGLLLGYGVSRVSSNFIAGMTILKLPGEPVMEESAPEAAILPGEPIPVVTEAPPPMVALPESWDGKTRVNMLVMGVDARSPDATAPLSDTMILFTFDPVSNTAGMLSIPRDLWVKIPGGDYARINTAYSVGESLQLPGGGPALAAETVEDFLGVPIHYYAQIDFFAFIDFIDHIGGVKVTVEQPIDLAFVENGGFASVEPGRYVFNGSYALAYVRNRDGGNGDIDRAKRQQQVILAVRDRLIQYDQLPKLLAEADVLYKDLSRGIKTNLELSQAFSLARRILEMDRNNIQHYVIDFNHVNPGTGPMNEAILRPIPDRIRELRDQVFYRATVSPEQAAQTRQTNLEQENALVSIINGSNTPALETTAADYLRKQGVNVSSTSQGAYQGYTSITIYDGKPHTARYLIDLLQITPSSHIVYSYDPSAAYDLVIVLGDDVSSRIPAQ